jgi:hypothetical protein
VNVVRDYIIYHFFSPKLFRYILLLLVVTIGDHHASVAMLGVILCLMTGLVSRWGFDMTMPSTYYCCARNLCMLGFVELSKM